MSTQELTSEQEARARDGEPSEGPRRRAAVAPRIRQREAYGGLHWGAAFFGWLVASGLATILVAILSAAGAALGFTNLSKSAAEKSAGTIGVGSGIAILAVLLIAYYAGGYVAGRMSRFDGARQGFGAWVIGIVITLLFAAAGLIFGSEYNVLSSLHLPRVPIEEGKLVTGGAIALAAIVIGTLITAVLGGRVGHAYHRRVDEAGRLLGGAHRS